MKKRNINNYGLNIINLKLNIEKIKGENKKCNCQEM